MAKVKGICDPFADREASKYEHPVPSREFILQHLEECKRPLTYEQLLKNLSLDNEPEQEGLRRRLRAMTSAGQLMRNRKGYYCLPRRIQLVRGRVVGHKDGFGFVIPDEGGDNLFLSPRNMRIVFDGDCVLVRVTHVDERGRAEADLVEILERRTQKIVGRFHKKDGVAFVEPHNTRISQDVFVKADGESSAEDGQIVVVEIVDYPSRDKPAIAQVVEVLGEHMAPHMEIDIAIRAYDLPYEWPAEVLTELSNLNTDIAAFTEGREDLRSLPFVTIDGETANDFDDAVYCRRNKRGDGWVLWVAIADVSHYVQPSSALDKEALRRGNSVYFPGRVLPMLPELLSNTLCSLQPDVDRLCMVCEMSVTATGKLTRYRFYPAVMHSQARLTYNEVASLLDGSDANLCKRFATLLPHVMELSALYRVLRQSRDERGAIDFDRPETRIIFGADRKIERIVPIVRNDAHRLIEECMLLANVATAKLLQKAKIPILYRVHEGPTAAKLVEVRAFLAELGLQLMGGSTPAPHDYATLLSSIEQRVDKGLIQTVLLRSLSQAVYSPVNKGHFGLAYPAYTHFTSPIRRYPDLLVHRAIRECIAQDASATVVLPREQEAVTLASDEHDHRKELIQGIGEHCSLRERRADEATRDAIAWLKCEFMLEHVGSVFPGVINTVTNFGLFVELTEFYVEGLVHISALKNDYYHFDPIKRRLRGERTGMSYRLGDATQVRVVRVDLDEKQIDFELVETKPRPTSTKKSTSKAQRKSVPKKKRSKQG